MRAPPDRFTEKSFFELLPKRRLLAALTLLVLLLVVLYARRYSDRGMRQLGGFFGSPPTPEAATRRARLAPATAPGERAP